ncbi:MAG: hypothetical protein V3V09_04555 [Arenicellales bacterium]
MQVIVEWDKEKNAILKKTRQVCFEDVENCILNDDILDILPRPNAETYPNQKLFIVRLNDYVHYVPFVEDAERIFLKSIIPARKYDAKY